MRRVQQHNPFARRSFEVEALSHTSFAPPQRKMGDGARHEPGSGRAMVTAGRGLSSLLYRSERNPSAPTKLTDPAFPKNFENSKNLFEFDCFVDAQNCNTIHKVR